MRSQIESDQIPFWLCHEYIGFIIYTNQLNFKIMKTKKLLLITALLFVFMNYAQNVITVDNSPGSNAEYNNLQNAIDAANSDDILYIHASETNYGDITIDKTLTLIGFSHSDTDKATFIENIELGENASNSKFSGLHITEDFIVDNLSTTLTELVFENNNVNSMIFDDAGVDDMIIRGNIIHYIGGSKNNYTNTIISNNIITNSIYLENNYQSVVIKNNIFFRPSSGSTKPIRNLGYLNGSITVQNSIIYRNGNLDANNNGVIFENCLTYSLNAGNVTALDGTNNKDNEDPLFVNALDGNFDPDIDDYHLQTGSPAIDAGVAGEDIGIYNAGPFEFNNAGYTAGIPTVKITSITNTVAEGESIVVTIESNSN